MERHAANALAEFCISQHLTFDIAEWQCRLESNGEVIVLVAAYLSMTSWYGHGPELERLVEGHRPDRIHADLHRESQRMNFDLPYFAVIVRVGVSTLPLLAR